MSIDRSDEYIISLIKELLKQIYIYDESVGTKAREYIPWWAK